MIECVNGNGQGCCDICLHIKGWHREWSSSLYYVRNKHGLYLRRYGEGDRFSMNAEHAKAAFCYFYGYVRALEEAKDIVRKARRSKRWKPKKQNQEVSEDA